MQFPPEVPLERLIRTLDSLRFQTVRTGRHIALLRIKTDGTPTPITIPNQDRIKASALRVLCANTGVPVNVFLEMYRLSE
jgi:hypothetical protein